MDTNEMFNLIGKGDQRGWDEFYAQTYGKATEIARSIVGRNGNDYESIVQEAYIKAYKNINMLENKASYKAWFNTIVTNMAKTQVGESRPGGDRYSVYNESLVSSMNTPMDSTDSDSDELGNVIDLTEFNPEINVFNPEDLVCKQDVSDALAEVINELSEDQRRIIMLRFYSGLKNSEIASMLNISENTVKTRSRRALMALQGKREELEKKGVQISGIAMLIMLLKWHYVGDTAYAAEFLTEAGKEAAIAYVKEVLEGAGVNALASAGSVATATISEAANAASTANVSAAANAASTGGATGTTATSTASTGVATGTTATGTASTVATTTAKAGAFAGKAIVTKAIAGVAAAAVIGGGAYAGAKFIKNNNALSIETSTEQATDEGSEATKALSAETAINTNSYFILENDYDNWVLVNASDEITNAINNIYSGFGNPEYESITNYTDKILCIKHVASSDEDRINYYNYDLPSGKRLILADVASDISGLCDEVIRQKKQEYPDFNEAYFREVFASLNEIDDYETRIKWRLDEKGLVISLDDDAFSQIAKDEGWLTSAKDVNVTSYVKDEYNTTTSVYGYTGGRYFGGRYTADDGTIKSFDVTNTGKISLLAFRGSGDEPYYRDDITQGGITVDNYDYYSKKFIIKNNNKAYFYIPYDNYAKLLVYDVTEDTPRFVGVYEGSYFPNMHFSNTDRFPMYHLDGTYGWYTIADDGMPVSLDEQAYTINESDNIRYEASDFWSTNETTEEAANAESSSVPSNDIEAKFEEYIKAVPESELRWDKANLRYKLIYLNNIPCIFFSFGTATANDVMICTYQNGAIQKPQYINFSNTGGVGYTTSGYLLAEEDRMGYFNHAIYTIGDGTITELCYCVYNIDEGLPDYTTEYDEFRINGANASRDEALQYYDNLIASIGADEAVFNYNDGKPLS